MNGILRSSINARRRSAQQLAAALVWLACFAWSPVLRGQTAAPSDLELTVSIRPGTVIHPGSQGQIVITVRNLGPNPANDVRVVSSPYETAILVQFSLFATSETAPCRMAFFANVVPPGFSSLASAIILFGMLAPNATVTCTIGIAATSGARGTATLGFEVSDSSPGRNDPNPSNNAASLALAFDPRAVPALSSIALALMSLLIACAGAYRERALCERAQV
jgi:Domain of unknown function DUF11